MSNKGFVYIMYDTKEWEDSTPIYIGKTRCLKTRLYSHFYNLRNGKMTEKEYESVKLIRIAELPTYADAGIVERYLVGTLCPKCNTQLTAEGSPTINVDVSNIKFMILDGEELDAKMEIASRVKKMPRRKNRRHKYLKLLERCYLVEHNGWSHFLHYPRSTKEIVFLTEEERGMVRDIERDITIFPEELGDVFLQTVMYLGIPTSYETPIGDFLKLNEFVREDINIDWFEKLGYQDMKRLRQEIREYMDNYSGVNINPFYAVCLNKGGSGLGARNFDTAKEAKEYAEKASKSWGWPYKVMYITENSVELERIE